MIERTKKQYNTLIQIVLLNVHVFRLIKSKS